MAPIAEVPDSQPEVFPAYAEHEEDAAGRHWPKGEVDDNDDPFLLQDPFMRQDPSMLPSAHRSSTLVLPEILIESAELEGPETLGTTAVGHQIDHELGMLAGYPCDNMPPAQADDQHLHAGAAQRRKDKGKERESSRQSKSPAAEVTQLMLSKASKSKVREPFLLTTRNI